MKIFRACRMVFLCLRVFGYFLFFCQNTKREKNVSQVFGQTTTTKDKIKQMNPRVECEWQSTRRRQINRKTNCQFFHILYLLYTYRTRAIKIVLWLLRPSPSPSPSLQTQSVKFQSTGRMDGQTTTNDDDD